MFYQLKPFLPLLIITLHLISLISSSEFKGFDDTVMFDLNWSGADDSSLDNNNKYESIFVTSANKEKYKCLIPSLDPKESENDAPYTGPTPVDLIAPLFSTTACSYRIESYWTYEMCHGNFIKQFHEEREGKVVKLQEYYLGKWDKSMTDKLRLKYERDDDEKLKYKKIDGLNLAYFEVQMTDGTLCDLNGEHRVTRVLYVCYIHGKNEIYSLKETSTCNYEIIILTNRLCEHPKYKPKDSDENVINCYSLEGSPKTPKGLVEMEDARKNVQKILDGTLRMHLIANEAKTPLKSAIEDNNIVESLSKVLDTSKEGFSIKDTTPVDDFLHGKHCLTGGTGWWKFELCYGKYARQFHEKEEIVLGVFNKEAHVKWLEENPHKRPKPKDRVQINHFYIDGTVCDKTLKRRQTEVQLKCLENASSPASVSLYLQEPKTCQYILVVESPLICDILQRADNDGLIELE